ncbi:MULTISPECIES: hypothetical protein [Chromobacterium]|uniref:hypothetical protein n=1 Tax=Chromobacterium TaxID=535 RepID=UPI000D2FD6A0|nr:MULTISPECIES: hypothetical protein [Chromobacterium]PTU70397.1 hypothetical protein DBB33_13535 [Chromobacterium haemolyticum]
MDEAPENTIAIIRGWSGGKRRDVKKTGGGLPWFRGFSALSGILDFHDGCVADKRAGKKEG